MPLNESATLRSTIFGIIAVLIAASAWALSGIFVKLIMAEGQVSSLTLAFWRDTATFVVFLMFVLPFERGKIAIRRSDGFKIAGMGISLGVFHVALNLGYWINGAAITTIQQAAMPAIVLIAARIVWKEPLSGLKILSLIGIGIGTVLVSRIFLAGAPNVTTWGIGVGFLIPTLYAGWSLFGKGLRSNYSSVVILTWAFGIASVILLSAQLLMEGSLIPVLSTAAFAYFCGLVGVSTVFAFFAFTYALGRLPAGVASILVMSEIALKHV